MRIESTETDVITSIAHKVAASREILLGKEDLPKSATVPSINSMELPKGLWVAKIRQLLKSVLK